MAPTQNANSSNSLESARFYHVDIFWIPNPLKVSRRTSTSVCSLHLISPAPLTSNPFHSSIRKTLGYIRRCLHSAPPNLHELAHQTFVRPKLEYAAAIWSPHQVYLINQLEAIQNRAAFYIMSSYKSALQASRLSHNWA